MIGLLWTHLESALKYNWLRKCFLHMIFSHYSPHICCSSCLSALVLLSLRPPAAASDHWWISCVTSRAPCSRARGTTAQCWRPPQTDAHPKTCTLPSCRSKTTAVSDDYYIQVKRAIEWGQLVSSPVEKVVIVAALVSNISNTLLTSGGIHLLWVNCCQMLFHLKKPPEIIV